MLETDREDPTVDSYDWLTIVDGPGVSGAKRIWFGRHDQPRITVENSGIETSCTPVEFVPLPRPMTRPEIEDWLDDGWAERILEANTAPPRPRRLAPIGRLQSLLIRWGFIKHRYGREYARTRYSLTGRRLAEETEHGGESP